MVRITNVTRIHGLAEPLSLFSMAETARSVPSVRDCYTPKEVTPSWGPEGDSLWTTLDEGNSNVRQRQGHTEIAVPSLNIKENKYPRLVGASHIKDEAVSQVPETFNAAFSDHFEGLT